MDGNVSAVPYIDLLFVMLVIAVRKGKKTKQKNIVIYRFTVHLGQTEILLQNNPK